VPYSDIDKSLMIINLYNGDYNFFKHEQKWISTNL